MIKRVVDAISGRVAGWRNWLKKQNPHLLGLVLVMAAFWAAMAFSEPVSPPQVTPLAPTVEVTPLPSQAATGETPVESPGPTPFPAELIANREQTFGDCIWSRGFGDDCYHRDVERHCCSTPERIKVMVDQIRLVAG